MFIHILHRLVAISCLVAGIAAPAFADGDLGAIEARGVQRRLGVPYANFVSGSGDRLDVEPFRLFARHIGNRDERVPAMLNRDGAGSR